jgi:hypothetical protein
MKRKSSYPIVLVGYFYTIRNRTAASLSHLLGSNKEIIAVVSVLHSESIHEAPSR